MKPSDNLHLYRIGNQFFTMYAPPQVNHYSKWEAIGGAVCVFILTIMLWMCG